MLERPVETGGLTSMASRAGGVHQRKQRVGIAVVTQLDELLHVSAFLALVPELLATAGVEPRGALFQGEP